MWRVLAVLGIYRSPIPVSSAETHLVVPDGSGDFPTIEATIAGAQVSLSRDSESTRASTTAGCGWRSGRPLQGAFREMNCLGDAVKRALAGTCRTNPVAL